MSGEINFLIKGNAGQLKSELAGASAAVKDFGEQGDKYLQKAGLSAKQLAFATRGIPAQFTDIAVSLQAGQNPLTVLLQQGGQLKDMFGGIGPAAKAMGGYIAGLVNPYTIAAAAAAALGYAWYKGAAEAGEYNKALILSGNTAGATAVQMRAMAGNIAASSSASTGAAAEAVTQFVRNGGIAAEKIQGFASTAVSLQQLTGIAVADTVKQFAELGKAPVEASLKLNETTGYLTAGVYEQIKALMDQGRTLEAGALAQQTYGDAMNSRMPQLEDNLLRIEKWWHAIAKSSKEAWAAMFPPALDQLSAAKKAVGEREGFIRNNVTGAVPRDDEKLNALKETVAYYEHIAASEKDYAAHLAAQNEQLKASVAWNKINDEYMGKALQKQKAITEATQLYRDKMQNPAAELPSNVRAGINKKFEDFGPANISLTGLIDYYEREQALITGGEKIAHDTLESAHKRNLISDRDYYTTLEAVDANNNQRLQATVQGEIAAVQKSGIALTEKASRLAGYNKELTTLRQAEVAIHDKAGNQIAEAEEKARTDMEKARGKELLAHAAELQSLEEKAQKIEDEVALYGLSKAAIEALTTARMLDRIEDIKGFDNSGKVIASIEQVIAARQRLAVAGTALDLRSAGSDQSKRLGLDAGKDGLPDFSKKQEDPFKDIGATLRATFDGAGTSLQKMTDAMGALVVSGKDYAKEMQVINAMKASKNPEIAAQGLKNENKLIEKNRDAQLGAFADLASGAKGLFAEKTAAYKVLDGVEKSYHLMQLANMAEQLYTSLTTITVRAGAETAQTAFMLAEHAAANVVDVGLTVGAETAKNTAKVPGVIMSFMSWLGPWGMAAAGVAIAAVLGRSGGGGGGPSAADIHKNHGTGTVLGDSDAKSNSLLNSLKAMEDNTFKQLKYSSGMLDSLKSIERAMGGLASIIFRTAGITGGNPLGIQEGVLSKNSGDPILKMFGLNDSGITKNLPVLGSITSALQGLWGKVTQSISDSGISVHGNLGTLATGQGFGQYTDVSTTESSWFGLVKNTSTSTQFSALEQTASEQFGKVFAGISETLKLSAVSFGRDADSVAAQLAASVISIPNISLRGLKGQELQDALQAVFSGAADKLAGTLLPGLESLQKAGEGYYETLMRASTALTVTNGWLSMFRQRMLQVSMAGASAATQLADLFGGINELNSASQAFYETYYTEGERAARSQQDMAQALASVNLAMPTTKDGLRALAGSLDLNTEAGRNAYAVLLTIAPEFSATSDALANLAKEQADAAIKAAQDAARAAQDIADKLLATFTGGGLLVPALDMAKLKVNNLTTGVTGLSGEMSFINSIMGDATSTVIGFRQGTYTLDTSMTASQVSAGLLNDEIVALQDNADKTHVNFAGLSAALEGVNTETFIASIGLVFENLAARIKGTIDAISAERIAVRDAALQIINPTVMGQDAIRRGIAAIGTTLPSNAGMMAAQNSLAQADANATQKAAAVDYARALAPAAVALAPSTAALDAAAAALAAVAVVLPSRDPYTTAATRGTYGWIANPDGGGDAGGDYGYSGGTPESFDQAGYDAATAAATAAARAPVIAAYNSQLSTYNSQLSTYNSQLSTYNSSLAANAAQVAAAQTALNAATANQTTTANAARQAAIDYSSALQNFAIDASKSVGKLSKLREETVKYFEAQKQLADLMATSAAGLRKSTGDYRFSQLTDVQKSASLAAQFSSAYSTAMAAQMDGATLAGYGDKLNSLLGPLIDSLNTTGQGNLINSYLAQADMIAGLIEQSAPVNYQQDSLAMLGSIDATLAALDASSKSAEKIISDAVNAGSALTASGLRAIVQQLGGTPAFAGGGAHAGGLRKVGENGPEWEVTGPSLIFNASQTRSRALGGGAGGNSDLIAEIRALRVEVEGLRSEARATAVSTNKTTRILDRAIGTGNGALAVTVVV